MHDRAVTDDALARLDCPSRRGVLRALAGVGVTTIAAGVLVACGSGDGATASGQASGGSSAGAGDGSGSDGAATGGTGDGAGGDAVAEATLPLADVPVGEAVVVDALGTRLVVAQPTAGEVVAFSASCTHAGTPVEARGGLELVCPNHGSRFDAADGSPTQGPATDPLPPLQARIDGDQVVLTAA